MVPVFTKAVSKMLQDLGASLTPGITPGDIGQRLAETVSIQEYSWDKFSDWLEGQIEHKMPDWDALATDMTRVIMQIAKQECPYPVRTTEQHGPKGMTITVQINTPEDAGYSDLSSPGLDLNNILYEKLPPIVADWARHRGVALPEVETDFGMAKVWVHFQVLGRSSRRLYGP